VRVPVLSNTMTLTLPALLTAEGAIQNIPFSFSLSIANIVPVAMAVGRVGGTRVVIKFRPLSIISQVEHNSMNLFRKIPHNMTDTVNQVRIKYFASSSNLYLLGFGNRKFLISFPLAVS